MKYGVKVRESKISGFGVFASKDFKKNENIITWNPKIITKSEFEKLPNNAIHYTYVIGSRYFYMQSPEKYVNHSCEANSFTENFSDVAIRNIKKGEEINTNYKNDGMVEFKCNCGNTNCRGVIS